MKKFILIFFIFIPVHAIFDAYRAQQLHHAGAVDEAKKVYAQQVVADFHDWRALYNLGTIALNQKQYADAVADFEKVVTLQPDNQEARRRLEIARKLRDEEKKKEEDPSLRQGSGGQGNEKEDQNKQEQQDKQDQQQQNKDQQSQESSQKNSQEQQHEQQNNNDQSDQEKIRNKKDEKRDQQKNRDQNSESNDPQSQEKFQKSSPEQSEKQQESAAAQQQQAEQKKRLEQAAAERAAQKAEQNKKFSKQDLFALQELDKIDKQVQKEMVRYAVSSQASEEQHAARKNW